MATTYKYVNNVYIKTEVDKETDDQFEFTAANYQFIKSIGRHGLYEHIHTGRQVLHKYYRIETGELLVELQLHLAKYSERNLCPIFRIWQDDPNSDVQVIEDYVQGDTLAQALASGSSFDIGECVSIASDVLFAISALNDLDIIHRDIKPDNIVVNYLKPTKLIDYDSACYGPNRDYIGEQTTGTVGYASPEHFSPKKVTYKSDLFSLGMVINELLYTVDTEYMEPDELFKYQMLMQFAQKATVINPDNRPELNDSLDFISAVEYYFDGDERFKINDYL